MFTVLSSWWSQFESLPGSCGECRTDQQATVECRPWDQATWFGPPSFTRTFVIYNLFAVDCTLWRSHLYCESRALCSWCWRTGLWDKDKITGILAMEEGRPTSSERCTGTQNTTGSMTSSGFIGPMSAVLVLDILVVVGNSLVVTAVFTHGKLRRSMTNRFIVSLAVADLMLEAAIVCTHHQSPISWLGYWCCLSPALTRSVNHINQLTNLTINSLWPRVQRRQYACVSNTQVLRSPGGLALWLARWLRSTKSGPVSTEMGDRVRVQFPVPDTYFGM